MVTTTGTSSTSPARPTSQMIMVTRRSQRSTSAPASGPSSTLGAAVMASAMPRSSGVPRSISSTPSATWWMRSPKKLISWPVHSSEKLRLRMSAR